MRKMILFLAFISLACTLPTALPLAQLTETVVPIAVPAPPNPLSCAKVVASTALNVRNENRAVVGWLYHGQEVQVSGTGGWVTVYAGNLTGKVKASYLGTCDVKETSRR